MPVDISVISGAIGGIAATVTIAWILRRIRPAPDLAHDGRRVLSYHRSYEVIGWVCGGFFLVVLVACLLTAQPKVRTVCGAVFGGFAVLGAFLVWLARRCTISYSDSEVRYIPLFGKPFSFPWASVVAAKYSIAAQGWIFRLVDGRKARVSIYMNGHQDFIQTARRHLSVPIPDAIQPAHMR